jgi:hypothetical protein
MSTTIHSPIIPYSIEFNTPLKSDVELFNNDLAKSQHRIDIVSYYEKALVELFKIDTETYKKDFATQLKRWVDTPDEFCIPHTDLFKYGVLSYKMRDNDIYEFFSTTHSYVECIDYIILEKTVNNGPRGRRNITKTYMMTPDVFKILLIRCNNTRKYADYYLVLEKVFVYYYRYQQVYDKTNRLNCNDDTLDNLTWLISNVKL